MEINSKLAEGIHIKAEDFEYVVAVRKPNVNTKIKREFWIKIKAKELKDKNGKEKL